MGSEVSLDRIGSQLAKFKAKEHVGCFAEWQSKWTGEKHFRQEWFSKCHYGAME